MVRRLAPLLPPVLLAPFALSIRYTADFGLAYQAGLEAWSNGRPQNLFYWTGTPLYAAMMALITRAGSVEVTARVFMALDLVVWGALLYVVWSRLHDMAPASWWWATLGAAAVFAPAISGIFWLQPNLFIFALALGGFVLADRRNLVAGLLIGASLALKPILLLLPLAMLLRRESRAAGLWAVVTAAFLTLMGLGFLAWRAADPAILIPTGYLGDFVSHLHLEMFSCVPENYSPVATLCRLGLAPSTGLTAAVAVVVTVAGWLLIRGLPEGGEPRWAAFSLACLLSSLVGPIDWASYGVLMAPLFLLIAYQFWRDSASPPLWLALGLAYLLTELIWDPLESLAQTSVAIVVFSYTAGQFGKYILLFAWIRWRMLRPSATWSGAVTP